jgi:inner membrane protein
MLARAGVGKGVPRAGLLLMLAANAPDLDIVSWFGGTLTYLEYHRWFTHSILAVPLMAAVAVGIARWFVRAPFPWVAALLAAVVGVSSHLLLDWTNAYGIRLLLPFSPEWLRLDITSVVDPWIWAVLLLAVIAPALGRLVSSEIGAKPGSGRGWAVFALLLLCGYEYARYMAHDRAVAVLNARIYDGSTPVRVAAFATYWNPLRWRGLVETSDAYRLFALDLARDFNPSGGSVLYKAEGSAATIAASKTLAFQRFLSFSSFPLWAATPAAEPGAATEVDIFDLRFGDPQHPAFVASALVNQANAVEASGVSFGGSRRR